MDSILDKKGGDIILLDIREQAVFANYFLICSGENERQLKALAENVAGDAKHKANISANSIEGEAKYGWVLVDFGDLIVHLFSPEKRDYYDLEDLWREARVVLRVH